MKQYLCFFIAIFITFLSSPVSIQAQDWAPQAFGLLPIDYGVFSISVVNENVVWAAAFNRPKGVSPALPLDHVAKVLKTTDGGISWEVFDVEETPGRVILDIVAFDENTAFISTQDSNNGSGKGLFKTEDGGQTWVEKFDNVAGGGRIHFFNPLEGLIINAQFIATTADGGDNWQTVPSANIPAFQNGEFSILASGINSYQVIGDNVWHGTSKGRVYRSKDKGRNWEVFNTSLGSSAFITSVVFKDELNGIAIDTKEETTLFSKTADGGETWENMSTNLGLSLTGLAYIPGTNVLIGTSGPTLSPSNQGTAYSEDDGKTWFIINSGQPMGAFQFLNANTGWSSRGLVTSPDQEVMYKWKGDIFVGIKNIAPLANYRIFPNPYYDVIFLERKANGPEITAYSLYDNNGKILQSGLLQSNHSKLNFGAVDPGIYFLELRGEAYKTVKKIIKAN